jgi:N-acetylmuramoyl-L-alanine amidase
MRGKRRPLPARIAALFLIFFFFLTPLFAEMSLFSLLHRVNGRLQWDPYTDMGVIISGEDRFTFSIDSSTMVHNYKEKIEIGPVRREDGDILFPQSTALAIIERIEEPREDGTAPRIAAVLLDPGHGGKDSGAIGTHKKTDGTVLTLKEKDIVLDISNDIFHLLKYRYPDKKILRTRSGDTYPSLEDRVEMANNIHLNTSEAIIFVSIHANASLNSKAKGFEVWYLPPDYRRELIDPKSIDPETKEILPILNTMLEEEYTVESVILAQRILQGIESEIGEVSVNRGLKDETWFVVRNANMPSVLVEIGFITNPEEAKLLGEEDHLQALTRGIYNGICDFIDYFEQTSGFTE